MLSEFLIVLIVSLLFGNGLLFLTGRRKDSSVMSLKQQIVEDSVPETVNASAVSEVSSVDVDEIYSVQASLRGVNEKINLAHERIAELETALQSISAMLVSSKEDSSGYNLEEKIKKQENFRRNTKIELEAIKKLLKQLREFRKIKTSKKTVSMKKKEEELNKKIHNLVFNVKKRK